MGPEKNGARKMGPEWHPSLLRFEFYLVGNPENRVSRDVAHMFVYEWVIVLNRFCLSRFVWKKKMLKKQQHKTCTKSGNSHSFFQILLHMHAW